MRYALMAKAKTGERLNIFKDGRTYASIHAARRARLRMNYCIEPEIDIDEVLEPKPEVVVMHLDYEDGDLGKVKDLEIHATHNSASTRLEFLMKKTIKEDGRKLISYSFGSQEVRNDS